MAFIRNECLVWYKRLQRYRTNILQNIHIHVQRLAKRRGCLLSYSQVEPGRELTQPSPCLLAEPCTCIFHGLPARELIRSFSRRQWVPLSSKWDMRIWMGSEVKQISCSYALLNIVGRCNMSFMHSCPSLYSSTASENDRDLAENANFLNYSEIRFSGLDYSYFRSFGKPVFYPVFKTVPHP